MALFDLFRGDSPDAFGKLVVTQLEKRGWPERPRYNKARFVIELGGGWSDYRLENVYQEWLQYPANQRKAAIDELVSGLFDPPPPETYEEAAPLLLPMIRNRAQLYNGAYRLEDEPAEGFKPPPLRPLAHLAVLAALDRPGSIMLIDEHLLQSWGKTFDEVLEQAIVNLRAREQRPFRQLSPKLFASDFQDYHDAARLLLPELLGDLPFKGAPLVVAAARSWVVIADSEDKDATEALARFVEATVDEDPRAIAYAPVLLDNGVWTPLDAEAGGHPALRRLAIKQSLWDHRVQREWLDAQPVTPDGLGAVAILDVAVDGDDVATWCVWTEAAPLLIPRSDLIGLHRNDEARLMVRWDDVQSIVGPMEAVRGTYPPLFRPPPWPDAGQWNLLSERSDALGWLREDRRG